MVYITLKDSPDSNSELERQNIVGAQRYVSNTAAIEQRRAKRADLKEIQKKKLLNTTIIYKKRTKVTTTHKKYVLLQAANQNNKDRKN